MSSQKEKYPRRQRDETTATDDNPPPTPHDSNGDDSDQKGYIKALEANPRDSDTWKDMGNTLSGDETVDINGTTYTKQDCYVKALEINPDNCKAWNNIGVSLSGDETVEVNGITYTRQTCLTKALEINPDDSDTWKCLARTLSRVSRAVTVKVRGTYYNKEACVRKAADIAFWVFIKSELDALWEKMGNDDGYSLSSGHMSNCYAKASIYFGGGNGKAENYICGGQGPSGALDLWLDGILREIQDADFTETLRRFGHIIKIAHFVNLVLSPSSHSDTEHHLQKALVGSAFFVEKRSWFLKSCFALIATARSGDSAKAVFEVLRFVSIETYVRLPNGKFQVDENNKRVTTSLAPEMKEGYFRALEAFYADNAISCVSPITTADAGKDANAVLACYCNRPTTADAAPEDLREVCVRELALARHCLGLDQTLAQDMVNRIFENEIKKNLAYIDIATSPSILEPLCTAYPSTDAAVRLKELYRLVRDSDEYAISKRTPWLEDKFGELFAKRLRDAIDAYTVSTLPKSPSHLEFTNNVGLAFDHFNHIVTHCFEQYDGFTTKLRSMGKAALKTFKADEEKKQLSIERCLSLDVDRTITGKNPEKSEDDITLRLSRISAVVAYLLTAQDEFEQAHIMYLDGRLLSNRNDGKQREYDRNFLKIVHDYDAKFNIRFASRRINDIEESDEIVKKLGGKFHPSIERPLFISSSVFGTVSRDKLGGVFNTPPGEIKTILDYLRSAFLGHTTSIGHTTDATTMCWLNFKGVASLKAVVEAPGGKARSIVTYNMTIAQAALLMYIQDRTFAGTPVTWADMAAQCWEKDGSTSLMENLRDLMNTKRGGGPTVPLIKPSNRKFDHTTLLALNNKFPTDKNTVDFAFKTKSSTGEDCIELSRVDKIKVCVVRYMKAHQRADYNTLLEYVKDQAPTLRIPEPSVAQFKKALDILMSGAEQYIRRDEEDSSTFVYIA